MNTKSNLEIFKQQYDRTQIATLAHIIMLGRVNFVIG